MRGRVLWATGFTLVMGACGGGGGSSSSPPPPPPPTTVTVSGTITYERPRVSANNVGLDYTIMATPPARGVLVEAVRTSDRTTVAASSATDGSGHYSLMVPANLSVFIRVKAEIEQSGASSWHYRILDNTRAPPALYAVQGGDFDSGVADSQRDLKAPSGWGGNGYTGGRAAAPFAILDAIYKATMLVKTSNANAAFPRLDIYWSVNNKAAATDVNDAQIATGDLITTYFDPANTFNAAVPGPAMFILGQENVDTDEYDESVIAHEWGHYFQSVYSRDDSTGGDHQHGDRLDLRLAFSEGWGNAFSGMALGGPVYRDAMGPQQSGGGCVSLDDVARGACLTSVSPPSAVGWYSEASTQVVIFKSFNSLGFGPIYDVMTGEVRTTRALTSMFAFAAALKAHNPASAAATDQLLAAQQISTVSLDEWATGETNDGAIPSVLPIFPGIGVGAQPTMNVCSEIAAGPDDKLGVLKYLRLSLPGPGTQSITVHAAGPQTSDPDIVLHDGANLSFALSGAAGAESLSAAGLAAGDYVIEVYESKNFFSAGGTPAKTCFSVSVTTP